MLHISFISTFKKKQQQQEEESHYHRKQNSRQLTIQLLHNLLKLGVIHSFALAILNVRNTFKVKAHLHISPSLLGTLGSQVHMGSLAVLQVLMEPLVSVLRQTSWPSSPKSSCILPEFLAALQPNSKLNLISLSGEVVSYLGMGGVETVLLQEGHQLTII